MKITKLILAAYLLMSMAACDTDKNIAVYGEDSGAIQIEAAINTAFTRSNPGAAGDQQKQFNEGDEIQLSCEDGYLNYVLAGGKWVPTDNYYLRWGAEPVTYSAFYPVVSGASTTNFTLPTNQQRLENLAKADYMTCTVENATDDGSRILRLGMNRKMAKVIMTLADVGGQGKVQGVKIGSYQGYTNGEVVSGTSLISPFITVPEGGKAGQNGCTYTAIVAPGKAGTTDTFVSLNYLGEDLVLPGIPELKPAKCYEFTLKVEGSIITISEPIVSPWDSGTLPGGDAEELQLAAYYVKEQPAGNATGMDWDNAMGVDALRNLLQTNGNSDISNANAVKLDGKKIYVAAYRVMAELDKANTGAFGDPEPVEVPLTIEKGPFIVISGHDLYDAKCLLEQTEGKGINVYTHSEMLPAHGYPELKKRFPHLKGNFGTAWQNQQREFEDIPAPVLFTTNCIMPLRPSYADRVFTTSVVSYPGVTHIGEDRDFSPVIAKALELGGYPEDTLIPGMNGGSVVTTGFAHHAVLSHAEEIVQAVHEGAIRHFFLIGGCDGTRPSRRYYTDFAKLTPSDTVILTLACGKFRLNDLPLGTVAGLPRILDVGQCNDAYSAIRIALGLAEAFDCSVNELPLSIILCWFEQKAVCVLMALLALGIRGIRLGPTLPAFLSPGVAAVLQEKYDLRPITTPEDDLAACLGRH